jgi:hypothetical protein
MADEYVCFDDSPNLQTYFIYADSEVLKEFLEAKGGFAKLTKNQQAELNKGFLGVRGCDKGVALREEQTYTKDGNRWVTDKFYVNWAQMRMRIVMTPETLRNKRTLEILNANPEHQSESARYGRCGAVADTLQQKGHRVSAALTSLCDPGEATPGSRATPRANASTTPSARRSPSRKMRLSTAGLNGRRRTARTSPRSHD